MTTTLLPRSAPGAVLRDGDPGYETARRVWNAMVDRRPAVIVRCASAADVVAAVRYAREHRLELGVRCGGHGVLGAAVPDGGLVIDLSPMAAVRVDPARRRARVGGGALLGALDGAAQRHGLATTAGNVSHTGVGGLTLGGGMGWLARAHGLTCDNVVSYEVVTAAGDVVRADADEQPELFWALRGGGGNFGVVTGFEFRLHHTGTRTLVAEHDIAFGDAAEALRGWRELAATGPREATFTATLGGDGRLTVGLVWVGDPADGARLLPALEALGRPLARRVTTPSYLELQRRSDTRDRHALRRYFKGHYLPALPDAAIEAFLGRGRDHGPDAALLPDVDLLGYGGAIADVGEDDSAFSHRRTLAEYGASSGWTDPAEDGARMAAARRTAAALEPFADGVYVNALGDEGQDGVLRAYGAAKLGRLTAVKDAFDPENVFHGTANIRPSRTAQAR